MSYKAVFATLLAAVAAGAAPTAFSGDATWYSPSVGIGACGTQSPDSDFVVALSPAQYASGANCFRHIGVNYQGKFVDATVVDLCPSCASGSIDLSSGAFQQLAPLDVGRIQVTWDSE